jgi:hypothetical protein
MWDRTAAGPAGGPARLPQLLEERAADGSLIRRFAHADGALTQYRDAAANTHYLLTDAQGTVRAVAGPSGAVAATARFDAYGRARGIGGGGALPADAADIGYTGGYTDRIRPGVRALAGTPRPAFRAAGRRRPGRRADDVLNRYAYRGGDPVNRVDPTGQFSPSDSASSSTSSASPQASPPQFPCQTCW